MSIPSGATHVYCDGMFDFYFKKIGDEWMRYDSEQQWTKYDISSDEFLIEQARPLADKINSPTHYTKGEIECIDAIESAVVGKSGIEAVCVANVIKYLWRYEEKGGVESIKKAEWYLNKLLEELK